MRAGSQEVLADYRLPDGILRALVAQRLDGRVAVSDIPIGDTDGRVYLVERHIESLAELDGLVAAYVEHSTQAGCPAIVAQRHALDELLDVAMEAS